MLYVFFGKDSVLVRERALAHIRTITDTTVSEVVKITGDAHSEGMLNDLAGGSALFGGEQVILLDTPSSEESFDDAVLKNIQMLEESPNHFVVIEEGLLAGKKKVYATHAVSIEEIAADVKEKFNTFGLAEAFLNRDKKMLWILLQDAWKNGEKNEAIVGIIFWQIKILRLAERTQTPEEAGQKPFPYNKAKRALSKFKKGELDKISRELLEIYHRGHGGRVDLSLALERWVLRV